VPDSFALDILDANAGQLRELRQAIRPLARKPATRMAKRRRRRRRGRLDVRRTLCHSLAYAGPRQGRDSSAFVR
jgi:uncharacterized protein